MARRPRLVLKDAAYHVMSRGNRKQTIFEDDRDREIFDDVVDEAVRRYKIRIYAACQMGTHYHLVLDTPRENLSRAMQFINGEYAKESNRRHGRTGHLFEDRFHSLVVQRERYLRRSCRYTVRNPVQAGLVQAAADWRWSTYKLTAGLGDKPRWAYTDWIDWVFEGTSRDDAQRRYQDYVNNPRIRTVPIDFRGVALGTKTFKQAVARALEPDSDRPLPKLQPPPPRPALDDLFSCWRRAAAQIEIIDTAHTVHGYSLTEIASFVGIDRSNIGRALRRFRNSAAS